MKKQLAKYEVKKSYLILYLCMFAACLLFVICRWISAIDPSAVLLPESINIHITNFSLSLMLLLFIGFTMLIFGGNIKTIGIFAILIVLINLVYEVFLPILNTPDLIDALFGILGTAIAWFYLLSLKRNGLIEK